MTTTGYEDDDDIITATGWARSIPSWMPHRGTLVGDVASTTARTLQLVDAEPFDDEDGGTVQINGVVYQYVAADLDADTITLSNDLALPLPLDGDLVYRWDVNKSIVSADLIVEVELDVDEEGDVDTITATIAQSLIDRISGGSLGERGSYLMLERRGMGGEWRVIDVIDQEQETDGTMIAVRGGAIPVYDDDGTLRAVIGLQEDGSYTYVEVNGAIPPTPEAPTADAQPGILVVSSYGQTATLGPWPADTHHLDVHIGASAGFATSLATKVHEFGLEGGVVSLALTAGTYYTKLVAVTRSGTKSLDSGVASAVVPEPAQGEQGVPGPPGESTYVWIKYADTPTTGMSDSPDGKTYLGIAYNKPISTESANYADYEWSLIQGPQGDPGVPGAPGADGTPRYTWVKYGTSAAGAGLSDDPTGKTYIGIAYNKTTAVESTNPGDYEWSLFQGPQGSQGVPGPPGADGQPTYTWVKYADTPTTGMSDSPTGKAYLGLAYNKTTAVESSTYADYSWSLIQGPQGTQGVPGTPGADGTPRYTWIKYADTAAGAGLSDSPVGKTYIGLAHNKTTATESTTPGDYQWALIQGEGRVYRTNEPPTGLTAGDVATWYDTNNDNLQHYWDGDTWEPFPLGAGATTQTILAGKQVPLNTSMSLEWGVPNPGAAPNSVTASWRAKAVLPGISTYFGMSGSVEVSGVFYRVVVNTVKVSGGYEVVIIGTDGSITPTGEFVTDILGCELDLTRIGTTWYVMICVQGSWLGGTYRTKVKRYDSAWAFLGEWKYEEATKSYAMTNNGANLLIARSATSIQVRVPTTGALSSTFALSAAPAGKVPGSMYYGAADLGATRISVLFHDLFTTAEQVYVYDTGGVAQAAQHFTPDPAGQGGTAGGKLSGIGWSPTNARWIALMPSSPTVRISSSNPTAGTVWSSYAWHNVATGYETASSPISAAGVVVPARAGLSYGGNAIPVAMDEDPAPDAVRVYGYTGATQPALSAARRMTAVATAESDGRVFIELPFSRGAQAPPIASTFPSTGAAGKLESEYGGFWIDGQGQGEWPFLRDAIIDYIEGQFAAINHQHPDLSSRVAAAAPVGVTHMWYGAKEDCPAGYLVLDGSTYSSATFPALFAHLGTTTLPDMSDRVPMGASGTKAVKSTGGADSLTMTVGQLPPHDHNMAHTHPVPRKAGVGSSSGYARGNGTSEPNDDTNAASSNTTGSTGSGNPIDITPKYRAWYFIMRAVAA